MNQSNSITEGNLAFQQQQQQQQQQHNRPMHSQRNPLHKRTSSADRFESTKYFRKKIVLFLFVFFFKKICFLKNQTSSNTFGEFSFFLNHCQQK